jgi:hypothetical protein
MQTAYPIKPRILSGSARRENPADTSSSGMLPSGRPRLRSRRHRIPCAAGWLLLLALAGGTSPAARAAAGGPDGDGYTWRDSLEAGGPVFQWIEINATGREVVRTGDNTSSITAASSGIGETVKLDVPWMYREWHYSELVPTSNGYLTTNRGDTGADFSPDCPLPATPSHTAGGADARLYVFHADLEIAPDAGGPSSGVYYQYFHDSPHPQATGGVHVFEWHRMRRKTGNTTPFSFQVLLFDNGDILMQYLTGAPETGTYFSIGVQDEASNTGLAYACNGSRAVAASRAVLFEPKTAVVNSNSDAAGLPLNVVTLRSALNDHLTHRIRFAPALAGQTITLTQGPLRRLRPVVIDASTLAQGITLSGGGTHVLFERRPMDVSSILKQGDALAFLYANNMTFTATPRVFNMDVGYPYDGPPWNAATTFSARSLLLTNCRITGCVAGPETALTTTERGSPFGQRDSVPTLVKMNPAAHLVLRGCTVAGNSARRGFAFYGDGGGSNFAPETDFAAIPRQVLVLDSVFENNTTPDADQPALFFNLNLAGSAMPRLRAANSVFRGNGLPVVNLWLLDGGPNSFTDCTFENNNALVLKLNGFGGGAATLERCTFHGNTAGGISADRLDPDLVNCTFSANAGADFSVLRLAPLTDARVVLSTLHNNAAAGSGAAFRVESNTQLRVQNSILDRNTNQSASSPNVTLAGGVAIFSGGNFVHPADATVPGVNTADPRLGPLAPAGGPTMVHTPQTDSPVLDAGVSTGMLLPLPATDQTGAARVQDSDASGSAQVNSGSVEYAAPVKVTTAVDETSNPATVSLREAVAIAGAGGRVTFDASLSGGLITLSSEILIPASMEIDAGSLPAGITLRRSTGTALRITGGHTLTLRKVTFDNCAPGVLAQSGADVTLINCRVQNCVTAPGGAGLRSFGGGTFVLSNTYLLLNQSTGGGGGALYMEGGGQLIMRDCAVLGNSAAQHGGGMYLDGYSYLTLERCTFGRNRTGQSGGAFNGQGEATLARVTVADNRAAAGVGSFVWGGSGATLSFCTVFRNVGTTDGHVTFGAADVYSHCIVAENRSSLGLSNGDLSSVLGAYNLTDSTGGFFAAPNSRNGLPVFLSPLGWHGGFIPTCMPLAHSPAIDAADPSTSANLQEARGFWNKRDGNNDGVNRADLGAVEAFKPVVVTTLADEFHTPSGAQVSLREAIRDCGNGGRILFAHGLNLGTATIGATGALAIQGKAVTIDATSLPRGITLAPTGAWGAMTVNATGSLSLHAVSIRDGDAGAGGGAIYNSGRTTLSRLALYDNTGISGGGGVYHAGVELIADHCTFSGNSSIGEGSAIHAASGAGPVVLTHCTLAENASTTGAALHVSPQVRLEMNHTVLAANLRGGTTAHNLTLTGAVFFPDGYNAADTTEAAFTGTGDVQGPAVILKPLTNAGGWSRVHPPADGSAILNAGGASFAGFGRHYDQCGHPRLNNSIIDLGAHETGGSIDFDNDGLFTWWEEVYGFTPSIPGEQTLDSDGDGVNNLAEFQQGTVPSLSSLLSSTVEILSVDTDASNVTLSFTSNPGQVYRVEWCADLPDWQTWANFLGASGSNTVAPLNGANISGMRKYFRVVRE